MTKEPKQGRPVQPAIRAGKIRVGDAVDFVAAVVCPDEFFCSAKRKHAVRRIVRGRIYRAAPKHFSEKPLHINDEVDAVLFYTWARNYGGWEKLQEIDGLPHRVRAVAGVQIEWDIGVTVKAKTYEELRPLYVEAVRKLDWQNRRVERLEEELRECRRKRKALSDKLSEAGKEGGRGNSK